MPSHKPKPVPLGKKKRSVKIETNSLTLGLVGQLDLLKAIFSLVQWMHFLKAKGATQLKIESGVKIRLGEEFHAGNLCKTLEEFLEFPLPADAPQLKNLFISLPAATSTDSASTVALPICTNTNSGLLTEPEKCLTHLHQAAFSVQP